MSARDPLVAPWLALSPHIAFNCSRPQHRASHPEWVRSTTRFLFSFPVFGQRDTVTAFSKFSSSLARPRRPTWNYGRKFVAKGSD